MQKKNSSKLRNRNRTFIKIKLYTNNRIFHLSFVWWRSVWPRLCVCEEINDRKQQTTKSGNQVDKKGGCANWIRWRAFAWQLRPNRKLRNVKQAGKESKMENKDRKTMRNDCSDGKQSQININQTQRLLQTKQ